MRRRTFKEGPENIIPKKTRRILPRLDFFNPLPISLFAVQFVRIEGPSRRPLQGRQTCDQIKAGAQWLVEF